MGRPVPFGKPRKAAKRQGDSGPGSTGRMPDRMRGGITENMKTSVGRENLGSPPVDGLRRGHDPNYPRKTPERA